MTIPEMPPLNLEAMNAGIRESLNALQVKHEEFFAAMMACVQPGATPEQALQIMPLGRLFLSSFLEVARLAEEMQTVALNTQNNGVQK